MPFYRNITLVLLMPLALLLPSVAAAQQGSLDVEAAYQAIPHKRTVFVKDGLKMPASDADSMMQYFKLLDEGIVLRVTAFTKIAKKQNIDREIQLYEKLLADFASLEKKFPKNFVTLTRDAVREQRDFYSTWLKDLGSSRFPAASRNLQDRMNDAPINSSSQKLIAAYGKVMETYPQESDKTKEAFFDYHCALDFK